MRIQQFLEHHGIASNPFADEDAQTDLVFKTYCIQHTYHPSWHKIYGEPSEPATAVVFGEKGSGKTALRLQIIRHLADYNAAHPAAQVFVVQYDDFNPFLDRFRERFSARQRRRIDRLLGQWKLWDHIDAILAQAVTQLVDRLLDVKQARHPAAGPDAELPIKELDHAQTRDLLLLAACYDQSTGENVAQRWSCLRRKLRFPVWKSSLDVLLGLAVTAAVFGTTAYLGRWSWLAHVWPYLIVAAGWLPRACRYVKWWWTARRVARNTRVLEHNPGALRRMLMAIGARRLAAQPLPAHQRTDDRYELLAKLQNALRTLGFTGVIVLVDRIDEPYLINGSAEMMRTLLWPMLDNKFLKHPGLGLKLLLPAELVPFIDRETRDFYERARLDKQNLVRSLEWTGQALYDVADARLKACAAAGQSPSLAAMFEGTVDARRLHDAFASLRVPRHLFKFMYRVLSAHAATHPEQQPVWQISVATFESVLAVYQRELDAADRGVGAV
jgi:hypothetical protein